VRDILVERASPAVRADIEHRVAENKLNSFHRWSYEDFLRRS
jgi:hypothetical protein